MRLPIICGTIRRRMLINFRADADAVQDLLPAPFRPKLHCGYAIIGICLIRLEDIRPQGLPVWCGFSSENAAHRIAVQWTDAAGAFREGVFIPRRDTSSWLNALAGGRIFPGEHHRARFEVRDDGQSVDFQMRSADGQVFVDLQAQAADVLSSSSCFADAAEASAFFEGGCLGYSVTQDATRLDGIRLEIENWKASPLQVDELRSTLGSKSWAQFDHALIMRNIPHVWREVPELRVSPPSGDFAKSMDLAAQV